MSKEFNFKLRVGSVVRLNMRIESITPGCTWTTGYYLVTHIGASFCSGRDRELACSQSYSFSKIRKDGTIITKHYNGYNCQAWDKKIEDGQVSIVSV